VTQEGLKDIFTWSETEEPMEVQEETTVKSK